MKHLKRIIGFAFWSVILLSFVGIAAFGLSSFVILTQAVPLAGYALTMVVGWTAWDLSRPDDSSL